MIIDSRGAEYECNWNNFWFQDVGESDIPSSVVEAAGAGSYGSLDDNGSPLPTSYYRLREGIERFFITDINNPAASATAQSTMPIMWDAWSPATSFFAGDQDRGIGRFNHVPGGSNVLYMDGHTEWVRYSNSASGQYPVWAPSANPLSSGSPAVMDAEIWMPFAGGWG
ncbi:MAG: hypothetical protein GWP08_11290 [Nitrospiraceae bacterium]|nr:hypothetical protein [Nitrospiraceae bacterium]